MYSLQQIAQITGSRLEGKSENVNSFLTDSRNLVSPAGILFVAIKTGKNNAHYYIKDLIEKGVNSFLIQEGELDISAYKNVSFLIAKNTLTALQSLAKYHRAQFKIPVIGITGSNGKTVVKEWLYQLLKNNYSICRSPKSFNSQIGVPLSVLGLQSHHTLAIFEAGISQPGEMQILADIIQPNIGIVTSIGTAHNEGFKNIEEKISEKLKLFSTAGKIIINGLDIKYVPQEIRSKCTLLNESTDGDIKIYFEKEHISLASAQAINKYKIPFNDKASVLNISTCIVVLRQLGTNENEIAERVLKLQPIALRLEIKNGINNSLIINDFYNSDLDSLKIALNFLQQQNRRKKKAIIISDIEQSGMLDNNLYREISELITTCKIDLVIGIGKKISLYKSYFKFNSLFFESTADFEKQFNQFSFRLSETSILLKGARSFGFENISNLLQLKSHHTIFEINLNKLVSNINYYKLLLNSDVKLMCMVKAMGYGGGSSELARTLQHIGVNYLAVAYADEGVELRQSQITLPIMVMSPEGDAFEDIINYNLEPEIYSFKTLENFILKLDQLGVSLPYPIHIKIDTGMHRLGFEEKDIPKLISILKTNTQLKVVSVFSHLAASDNPALDEFTNEQIKIFKNICFEIEKGISYSFIKHICNSGGISRFKNAHLDMVRLGIGMHGVGVNEHEQKHLENVGSLKTQISQIKNIKAGESVSYNRSGKTDKNIRIAVIPIGYADGFSRALGNGKFGVYIHNTFCKTIGNVCMDMCMVDVTELNCEEGDEVIVFENNLQLQTMAQAAGTISYEILTSVSGRVKRIYVQE